MNTSKPYANPQEEPFEKRPMVRRTVDYGCPILKWRLERYNKLNKFDVLRIRPFAADYIRMRLPQSDLELISMSLCLKYVHTSANRMRHVVNFVRWTPNGRRLLAGSSVGEFTLWNGATFNFELLNQAHDGVIRCAEWSHDGKWLLSGDGSGQVKYWQTNLNNVRVIQAHDTEIRDLALSPQTTHFVTASDDSSLKIFNFNEGILARELNGHGWDVKCCDWHPTRGLIVSGSKDNQVKFWDPRTQNCILTLHHHKNTVMQCAFAPHHSSNLVATCSRDSTSLIFDIRMMQELFILRGHPDEVTSFAWHPIHSDLISTGGSDGSINHYILSEAPSITQKFWQKRNPSTSFPTSDQKAFYPTAEIRHAHDLAIWSMQYHPLGHLLATGSNDKTIRFWCRARPDDELQLNDSYHLGENADLILKKRMEMQPSDEDTVDSSNAAALPGLASQTPIDENFEETDDWNLPGLND